MVRKVVKIGAAIAHKLGTSGREIREAQEIKRGGMAAKAQAHLRYNPEFYEVGMELRRLGAIPRYRGMAPGAFRAIGLGFRVIRRISRLL